MASDTESEECKEDYIIVLDDGGKEYVYTIDGNKVHFMIPPDDFDPVNASDEELKRYCFPERPDDKEELKQWNERMRNYQKTSVPELKLHKKQRTKKKALDYVYGTYRVFPALTSVNWSGYIIGANTPVSEMYSQVQMNYIQPSVASTIEECVNSYWIGIGGYKEPKLVQAGTATEVLGGICRHYAWYECISSLGEDTHMVEISNFSINAGDSIHVYISFEKENNRFTYYIANNTTGNSVGCCIDELNANYYYDGSTAEWIIERCWNSSRGRYMRLANYGNITASLCQYKRTNIAGWNNISSASDITPIRMVNNNNVLSTPSSIFGGSCFTCTWQGYN